MTKCTVIVLGAFLHFVGIACAEGSDCGHALVPPPAPVPAKVVTEVTMHAEHSFTTPVILNWSRTSTVWRKDASVRASECIHWFERNGKRSDGRRDEIVFNGDSYVHFFADRVQTSSDRATTSLLRIAFLNSVTLGFALEGGIDNADVESGATSVWDLLSAKTGGDIAQRTVMEASEEYAVFERQTPAGYLSVWFRPTGTLARFALTQTQPGTKYKSNAVAFRASEFRVIDGVEVPWAGEFTLKCEPVADPRWTASYSLRRVEMHLHANPPGDTFIIKGIPNGTRVVLMDDLDKPIPHVWRDGKPVADIDYELLRMLEQEAGRGPTTQKKAK